MGDRTLEQMEAEARRHLSLDIHRLDDTLVQARDDVLALVQRVRELELEVKNLRYVEAPMHFKEARREERERCAKAVCKYCVSEGPATMSRYGIWAHETPRLLAACAAAAIWVLPEDGP